MVRCPRCGADAGLDPRDRFCGVCGTTVRGRLRVNKLLPALGVTALCLVIGPCLTGAIRGCSEHRSTPAAVGVGSSLPDLAVRDYSDAELRRLSDKELCIARNEIYARHGLIFGSPVLRQYFSAQPWYRGTTSSDSAAASQFNAHERTNVMQILALEKARGSKYLRGPVRSW